jgi:hypothetical protein
MSGQRQSHMKRVFALCWPSVLDDDAEPADARAIETSIRSLEDVLGKVVDVSGPQTAMAHFLASELAERRHQLRERERATDLRHSAPPERRAS